MLSRNAKALFYASTGPFMKLNGYLYRKFRAPKNNICVHLGPGQKNYIDGWINVDANMFTGKCDVWADLRNKLPFHDNSAKAIYSHHMVEHLPNLHFHFQEVYRCLKPGGVYRVGGPNGDEAIKKFIENDFDWFGDFPDSRTSIGGRFENFIFCRQEHLTILTESYLKEIMENVGFKNIRKCMPVTESNIQFKECMDYEYEKTPDSPHTLLLEGEK